MESEQKLQTLIHMAIDVKNRQINQHYLVKLFEIIIKNSPQLANCDVDLTPNDEKHSQTNVSNKGIHEVSINPLNDIFDVSSSNHDEMLYEYENEELLYKYENEENSSLMPKNNLDDFSNSNLTLEDKKPLMEKSESCLHEWTENLETQQNVVLLRLNTSLRTDRFMTQEWVCLNLGMSAGNFREFDLDYRTNFKNIFNFLELQKSVNRNTRIDIQHLKKKCIKIQKYIKKHIDMDPEATGVVTFMKGACMSCGRPAKMVKTKRLSLNYSDHRRQLSDKSNPIEKKEIYQSNSGKTIKNKPKQWITNNQCTKPTRISTETCLWINGVPQPCHPFSNKRTGNVEIDLERIRADVNSRKTINDKLNSNNPREKPAMKPSIKVCGFIRNALRQRTTSLISSTYDDSNFSCCFKGHQKRKSKKRQIWKS